MSAKILVARKSNLGITVDSLEDGKNLVSAHHHLWQLYFLIEPNAAEGDSKKKKNNHHLATLSTVNSIEKNSTEDRYAEAISCLPQQRYRRPRSFSLRLLLHANTENPAMIQ